MFAKKGFWKVSFSFCLALLIGLAVLITGCGKSVSSSSSQAWQTPTGRNSAPDWVVSFGTSTTYPTNKYLVGFGSAMGKDPEATQTAQNRARSEISRIIRVDIQNLFASVVKENNQGYWRELSSITHSATEMELVGVETKLYVDEKAQITYALAYVKRSTFSQTYSARKSALQGQIKQVIADARGYEDSGESVKAVNKYLSALPLYDELKKVEIILLAVRPASSADKAFDELDKALDDISAGILMSQAEVENKIAKLLAQNATPVDDAARTLMLQLSKGLGEIDARVLILPFTYQGTAMTSQFSRYLQAALENQLGQMANWKAVPRATSFQLSSGQTSPDMASASGATWVLSGSYWQQGEKVKVLAIVRDVASDQILASADTLFDIALLESAQLEFKPQKPTSPPIEIARPEEPPAKPSSNMVAFPEDKAGISAYVKLDKPIDLDKVRTIFPKVIDVDDNYIIGVVPIPNVGGNTDVHLYADTNGWLVAYLLREELAAKIMKWPPEGYKTEITLEEALSKAARALGISIPTKVVQYYDFGYSEANRITLFVKKADGPGIITQMKLSANCLLYDASYYLASTGGTSLSIDETSIVSSYRGIAHSRVGSYEGAITTGVLHTIEISGYGGVAAVATALVLQTDKELFIHNADAIWTKKLIAPGR